MKRQLEKVLSIWGIMLFCLHSPESFKFMPKPYMIDSTNPHLIVYVQFFICNLYPNIYNQFTLIILFNYVQMIAEKETS